MALVASSSPPLIIQISLPIQSFFYGVFLVLFCLSTILFWYRHQRQRCFQTENSCFGVRPVLILSFLLSITVTGHWIAVWADYFQLRNGQTRGPASYELVKSLFITSSIFLADVTFVYRLWIVWGNNVRIIIFPCMASIGMLLAGTNIIVMEGTFDFNKSGSENMFNSWLLACIILTICTNIYCSVFISWKIWKVSRQAGDKSRGSNLLRVLSMIVESAAFYTSWMATGFGLQLAKSPVSTIFIEAGPAAAAVAFMLINVRVGLGWAATQNRAWRDTTYDFKMADGELRFALTTDPSILCSVLNIGHKSTTNASERP